MKHRKEFRGMVSCGVEEGAKSEGVAADIGGMEIEDMGEYSIMSWILRDEEIGKDVVFKLKVNNTTNEVMERTWTEKDGESEKIIRYENFEVMRALPHDAILRFKAIEEEMLKSGKKE